MCLVVPYFFPFELVIILKKDTCNYSLSLSYESFILKTLVTKSNCHQFLYFLVLLLLDKVPYSLTVHMVQNTMCAVVPCFNGYINVDKSSSPADSMSKLWRSR